MKLKNSLDIDPTQLKILTILNQTMDCKKFTELNADKMESDGFSYHLKFLLDHGFIERKENGYCISKRGEKLMADIDLKGNRYDLFRFSITVNAIKYIDGKKYILVQKRNRHPYFGDTNTIAGKVKKGESVKDAAIRKLKEEAGLDVEDVKVLGVLRKVRFDQEGNFLEDVVYTTCYCENPTGLINDENEWSKNWWCEINEFLEIMKNNIDYGKYDREVILRIRDGNFNNFYFEQFEKVRDY